jgi:hypothetical protein
MDLMEMQALISTFFKNIFRQFRDAIRDLPRFSVHRHFASAIHEERGAEAAAR